ncbi:MAG: hypothetical protein ACOCVJ_02610 [Verrucomicrobiota bacterium]
MNLYHTTNPDGISEINPDRKRMRELLDELTEADDGQAPHPDVSLVHDASGWALTVYASGVVTFENLDQSDDLPRYLSGVSRSEILAMWIELSKGRIEQVNSRPWLRDEA